MTTNNLINIYTEMTPNPESLKFVVNQMLLTDASADFPDKHSAQPSPLAVALFDLPFVHRVFISQNFVSITKQANYKWEDIIATLKEFIKKYVEGGKSIFVDGFESDSEGGVQDADTGAVKQIKEVLETYVRPAVEMDGGAIRFKSYEDGVVTVQLQGACSGCPSVTVTLRAGIEGLMKKMVPEVKEVIAEEL